MKARFGTLFSAGILGSLADLVHTGVTLGDLIHETPSNSISKGVASVAFMGMNKNKGLWHITYRVFGKESYSDPRGHLVKMRFLPDPETQDVNDLEVEVSCDCGAFVFWGAQYNVKQRTALERDIYWTDRNGRTSLDQSAPTEPEHNYVICKHIFAAAQRCASLIKRHLEMHKRDEELKNNPPAPETPEVEKAPVPSNQDAVTSRPKPKGNTWINGIM